MASAELPLDAGSATAPPVVRLLKAYEVAEVLGVGANAVAQLCRDGVLPATRPMKAWLIHPDALQAYLDAHSNQQVSA